MLAFIQTETIEIVVCAVLALLLLLLWKFLRRDQFIAVLIGTVLALGLAEVLLRVLDLGAPYQGVRWNEPKTSRTAPWQDIPALEKSPYLPNVNISFTYPDNPRGYFDERRRITGHINSLGFRGKETGVAKPSDTFRVAMLGDSFTMGVGVKDDHTLPVNLQRELNTLGRQQPFEVLNFGRSATSTKYQVKLLEEFVLMFEPDLVVIVMFLNDAKRIGVTKIISQPQAFEWLRRESYFANTVISAVEKMVTHRNMVDHYLDGYRPDSRGWHLMQKAMDEATVLSETHGFQLAVALFPVLVNLDGDYPFDSIHETIAGFMKSRNTPFVDFLPLYRGREDGSLWVHEKDLHPNQVATALAAKNLAGFLEGNGLLD